MNTRGALGIEYSCNLQGQSNPVMKHWPVTATAANQPDKYEAVALNAGLAQKADSDSTAILGISKENTVDGEVLLIVDPKALFWMPYSGTTKTSLTNADLGAAFDLGDDAKTLDLDASVTDQFMVLDYDNVNKAALVRINKPVI